MIRSLRRFPLFKVLVIGQTALLALRHLRRLDGAEWRRVGELVRRGRGMDRTEREELRGLLARLEPRAVAFATANAFSPVPLPRRLAGRSAP